MNTSVQSATTPTLLHIDASPRGARSHSRRIGERFRTAWRSAHPNATILTRDIGRQPPPFITEAWVEGAFAPPDQQSPAARDAIAVSNRYVDELLAADEIVITTPIYNLHVPASLKAWIDQIVRAGRTFATHDGAFEGLAKNKRAIVIVASGGDYRPGTPGGGYNFIEPYLRGILGFIGITRVEFVYAHSLSAADTVATHALASAQALADELAVAAV